MRKTTIFYHNDPAQLVAGVKEISFCLLLGLVKSFTCTAFAIFEILVPKK